MGERVMTVVCDTWLAALLLALMEKESETAPGCVTHVSVTKRRGICPALPPPPTCQMDCRSPAAATAAPLGAVRFARRPS